MPLPWRLPSDQETDEQYRRFNQLVADLYALLRTILLGQPPQPSIQQGDVGVVPGEEGSSGQVRPGEGMPDLVAQLGEMAINDSGTPDSVDSNKSIDWTSGGTDKPPMR